MRLLEVCVTTLENARAAERGGADRVEVCVDLPAGGVTPPDDLVLSVVQALSIPVHVLIRPRAGSFVYSEQEIDTMRQQIDGAKRAGAAGVVLGILQSDSTVNVPATRALIEHARPMKVTFHRAFDETADKVEALEAVIQTGADCLLTSGGAPDVLTGAEEIARLREQAAGRLQIMAGGGLRLDNFSEVIRRSGPACVHGSFTWRDERDRDLPEAERVERRVRQAVHMLRTIEVDQRMVE
jgi:copper homeostasis protein